MSFLYCFLYFLYCFFVIFILLYSVYILIDYCFFVYLLIIIYCLVLCHTPSCLQSIAGCSFTTFCYSCCVIILAETCHNSFLCLTSSHLVFCRLFWLYVFPYIVQMVKRFSSTCYVISLEIWCMFLTVYQDSRMQCYCSMLDVFCQTWFKQKLL